MVDEKYLKFKIKEFKHWALLIHEQQFPYIGRCYAWAHRADADVVTDMRPEESNELFHTIVPLWNQAVHQLFKHDRPNVSILGNEAPHLHAHLIPRYHTPREYAGITFIDPRPNGNYAPYEKKELPLELILKIKEEITAKM